MVISPSVNARNLIATACAAAVAAGSLVAPAQAETRVDPIGKECKAATAAARLGQPIPNLGNYVFSSNYNALDGNTLRLYSPEKYKPYVAQAMDEWVKATGGLVRYEFVSQPGYKVVTVEEANLGTYIVGRVTGNVNTMKLLLNPDILRNGYVSSLVMTSAHELGHAMGLAHSCDGALMKDGTSRGKGANSPQALDVQVLIQANNLREVASRPTPTSKPAGSNVIEVAGDHNATTVVLQPTVATTTTTTTQAPQPEFTIVWPPREQPTPIDTTISVAPKPAEPTPEQPKRVNPLAVILPIAVFGLSVLGAAGWAYLNHLV